MTNEWDFEGNVTFLTSEEGGRVTPASMGYFPSFRYPDFDDAGQFIARPVAGFRADGTPYDEGEPLDAYVVFRFRFPDRRLYEGVHHARLTPGRRFELTEGFRAVARGEVFRKREDLDPIEADVERLVDEIGDALPRDDAKVVLMFLFHGEWECAVHHLWWTLSERDASLGRDEHARLLDVARRAGFDLERAGRERPLRVREP